MISYFVCLGKDKDFLLSVRKKYTDYVEAHPGIRVKARYFVAFLLLSSGAFFLTDFYLDFHNIISDTVGGFLLLLGVLLLAVPRKKLLPAALFASIYTVVATISSRKSYAFASSHIGSDISRSEVVASEYNVMWLWALGEMLCFLLFLLFLLLSLRAVLLKWGGYRPEFRDLEFEARHEKKIRDEFDWILIKCYILGFISAVLSFLFDYLKTWTDAKELRYLARLLEALWIPDFIFGLFFAAYFSYLLTLVFAKINERFEFD